MWILDQLRDAIPAWTTPAGRVIYGLAVACLTLYGAHSAGLTFIYAAAAATLVGLATSNYLWYKSRVPMGPKEGITIAFAIRTADDVNRELVDRDLVEQVRIELDKSGFALPIKVINVPAHHCINISETEKAAVLRAKMRAHFLVWGDIRKRHEFGSEIYVLALEGIVAHREADQILRQQFLAEMRAILPRNTHINCQDDLRGFEATSTEFDLASLYIIAVAAMLSMDFKYGLTLLDALEAKLDRPAGTVDSDRQTLLRPLVKRRRSDCHIILSRISHARWRLSRNLEDLLTSEKHLELYKQLRGEDFDYLVNKAICDFVLRRDIASAKSALTTCAKKQKSDLVSRYGLAFLWAVEGNLDESYRFYREAFSKDEVVQSNSLTGEPTAFEIEEFLEWCLRENPSVVQLHYCLGLLNMRRKKDRVTAKRDFDHFLASTTSAQFINARTAAKKYLVELSQ
jgi:hypothetical protein